MRSKKVMACTPVSFSTLLSTLEFNCVSLLDGKVIVKQHRGSKKINVTYAHDKGTSTIHISYTKGNFSISQLHLTHADIFDTLQGKALAIITPGHRDSNILYCRLDDLPNFIPNQTDFLWESVPFYVENQEINPQDGTLIVRDIWRQKKSTITLKRHHE